MRGFRRLHAAAFACLTFVAFDSAAAPRVDPTLCAWPVETAGTGLTNVAYPDKNATYWTMPLDRSRWQSMTIKGTFPRARFFSFVSYTSHGVAHDSIVDNEIVPDAGSHNPFVDGTWAPSDTYTVTVGGAQSSNNISLDPESPQLTWVIYRIYVSNDDNDREAGVPLPEITLVGSDPSDTKTLTACQLRDGPIDKLRSLLKGMNSAHVLDQILLDIHARRDTKPPSCQPEDDVVFWIPKNTGGYFPNPANKYIAAPGLCFDRDKVVVVRGKAAGFPNTHEDQPVWEPATPPGSPIQLRYWSMCNNDQLSPYPVVDCRADWNVKLDENNYYTYVVADATGGQVPSWLPSDATVLPWGTKNIANILIFRNMLPEEDFTQTVQAAIAADCVIDNQPGVTPDRELVDKKGQCAANVMGEYYPRAVYCDKSVLAAQGWQGCFANAASARRN
ncbi:MAG TPA: hypothetical protein VJX31_11820 [Casimicrobiaceae bacterium]|nr:hypothetical protein [Casimicrobiaceae bacterium]